MKILDTCRVSNASNGTGHEQKTIPKNCEIKEGVACAVKYVLVVGG